jgi:hypothetical protein
MKEYPCCGFIEAPYWRNVRYRLYTQYCRIDDLEMDNPVLSKKIKLASALEEDVIDGKYIYHLVKGGVVVQRIHVLDSRDGKTIREPEQEKHFKFVAIGQKKLEACFPS